METAILIYLIFFSIMVIVFFNNVHKRFNQLAQLNEIEEVIKKYENNDADKILSEVSGVKTKITQCVNSIQSVNNNSKSISDIAQKITFNQTDISENQNIINNKLFAVIGRLELIEKIIKPLNVKDIVDIKNTAYKDLKSKYDVLMGQKSHIHLQRQIDVLAQERKDLQYSITKIKGSFKKSSEEKNKIIENLKKQLGETNIKNIVLESKNVSLDTEKKEVKKVNVNNKKSPKKIVKSKNKSLKTK